MTCILLTGSSRGIGAETRDLFEKRGAIVIGHASQSSMENQISADFTDASSPQLLWSKALNLSGGKIDILVNNAGIFRDLALNASDIAWLDGWEETLRVNLSATAQLCRFAIKHWQERKSKGRIVHVASRAGHRGDSPAHWHYAASKGGMLSLHKTIARGYANQGITSFAIAPGFTDTSMADDYLQTRGGVGILSDIPLGRVATPTEIAKIIEFCALDAPESMTGAVIDANGASYVR